VLFFGDGKWERTTLLQPPPSQLGQVFFELSDSVLLGFDFVVEPLLELRMDEDFGLWFAHIGEMIGGRWIEFGADEQFVFSTETGVFVFGGFHPVCLFSSDLEKGGNFLLSLGTSSQSRLPCLGGPDEGVVGDVEGPRTIDLCCPSSTILHLPSVQPLSRSPPLGTLEPSNHTLSHSIGRSRHVGTLHGSCP